MLGAATSCISHDALIRTSVPTTLNTLPAERNLSVASKDPNCSCSSACWRSDLTWVLGHHSKPVAVAAEFALACAAKGSPLRSFNIKQPETGVDSLSTCRPLRKRPYYADPRQGPCSDACWRSEAAAAVQPDAGPAGSAQPAARDGCIVAAISAAAGVAAAGIEQEKPAGSSAPDRAAADAGPAAQAGVATQQSLTGTQRTMRCKADRIYLLNCHGKLTLLQCPLQRQAQEISHSCRGCATASCSGAGPAAQPALKQHAYGPVF